MFYISLIYTQYKTNLFVSLSLGCQFFVKIKAQSILSLSFCHFLGKVPKVLKYIYHYDISMKYIHNHFEYTKVFRKSDNLTTSKYHILRYPYNPI